MTIDEIGELLDLCGRESVKCTEYFESKFPEEKELFVRWWKDGMIVAIWLYVGEKTPTFKVFKKRETQAEKFEVIGNFTANQARHILDRGKRS